jgi:glycosyltransferase involved in cell wall biosynthesis
VKILFSLTYFEPYISGLTICVSRMARGLRAVGHETKVICIKHDKSLADYELIDGIKVTRVEPQLRISKGFLALGWLTKSFFEVKNSDTVVVNLPQVEGVVIALWSKILQKNLIACYVCEIKAENFLVQKGVEISSWVTLFLANKIVTLTEDYAINTKLLHGFMAKVTPIYPLIPKPGTDRELEMEIRKRIGDKIAVGVAARLAREKGIEYLLEATGKLPKKWIILFAGPLDPVGEERYKERILKLAETFKDRVIFWGSIPPEKMGAFYSQIKALVLPSINSTEAFGMVQVEAMKYGVPVVASDLPGVRIPILKTGMGLLVNPRNSEEISRALTNILADKNKYSNLTTNVNKEFDEKKTVKSFEKLLLWGDHKQ